MFGNWRAPADWGTFSSEQKVEDFLIKRKLLLSFLANSDRSGGEGGRGMTFLLILPPGGKIYTIKGNIVLTLLASCRLSVVGDGWKRGKRQKNKSSLVLCLACSQLPRAWNRLYCLLFSTVQSSVIYQLISGYIGLFIYICPLCCLPNPCRKLQRV